MIKPHTRGRTGLLRSLATRFLALSVLASMIASLAVITPVQAADDVIAATDAASMQVAQANPFSDVPENSWAYDAVRQLAAAGLVTGYPDNTFKGNRPMTRYEMAVLVNRAVNAIQSKIAGGSTVKQSDLDAIKKLVDAFGPELRAVQAQVRALQQQQAALKTSVDAVKASNDQLVKKLADDEVALRAATASLAASHAGYSAWDRVYTGSQQVGIAQAGGGIPVPTAGGAAAASFGTLGGTASIPTGPLARMFQYQGVRVNLSGAPDPRIQFAVRLESVIRTDSFQTGTAGTTAGFCTATTATVAPYNCQQEDYTGNSLPGETAANLPARVAYSWFGYFSPGGVFAKIGRISEDEGRNADGIALGGAQANGFQIGFKDSQNYAYVFANTQNPELTNIGVTGQNGTNSTNGLTSLAASGAANGVGPTGLCPFGYPGNGQNGTNANAYGTGTNCITQGSNGIAAMYEHYFPSMRTAVGFTYDGYNAVPYNGWNPYAGLCVGTPGAASVAAAPHGTSTTAGAGTSTWNTAVAGFNGYCPLGTAPLVAAAGPASNVQPAGTPITGAYQTIATNIKTSSVYGVQYFGPKDNPIFRLTGEYLWRWGNDPFSAANPASGGVASKWKDNATGFIELAYNSKGALRGGPLIPGTNVRNSNFVVLQYYNQGLNSIGLDNGVAGTLAFQSTTFYTNYSGTNEVALYLGHWFTPNFRSGLTYFVFSNRGVPIPAGSTTCPTCTVSGLVTRAIGWDSYLVW
jgi:hypothetical protein